MDFIEYKSIFTILHIFGAVLGAGGAYLGDAIFFSSVKDKTISKDEFRFMKLSSYFVWAGLILSIISGILLFMTNPDFYLASDKFLIKTLIVGIIFVNGIFFHIFHFPRIYRHISHHYPSSDEFMRKKKFLVISGVISITSWTAAVALGSLRSIPISFSEALITYVLFEAVAICIALTLFKKAF